MRILQLSPQVPYPLVDGGKVSIFNITKYLALRGHQITFLALDRGGGADSPMEEFCKLVTVPHSNANSRIRATRNLFSSIPYNLSKYQSGSYEAALTRILEAQKFDIVHVDYIHMAHYGLICRKRSRLPLVLREHDVSSTIMERFAETLPFGPFKFYINTQVRRIRKYEGAIASQYELCCAMSEEDKRRLMELHPSARVEVIPAGVESSYFAIPQPAEAIPNSISFFGGLDWIPNQDALRWFLDSVFPIIQKSQPDATLFIIGKSAPPDIIARQSKHVVLRGFVPDLKQEVQRYSVTIAPFRIGGGMRLKILESFAMRIPVVSTSVGCEGIEAVPGKHLLVGDTVEEFASQVLCLLRDHALRRTLTENASKLAYRKYRWESVAEMFEKCYAEVIGRLEGAVR